MDLYFQVLFAVYAVVLVGTALLSRVGEFQTWQMQRLAKRVGLGIPADLDALIRRRVAARVLGSSVGGVVGLGAGVVLYESFATRPPVVIAFLVLITAVTGSSLGTVWASLRDETAATDRPRIARAEAVAVGDYVIVLARIFAWAILVLAAVAIALSARSGAGLAGILLVALGAVCLVLFEIFSRRIVARGHPVASTDELVWNDALTASALMDLLAAPVQALALGGYWAVIGAGGGPVDLGPADVVIMIALLLGCILFSIVFRNTRTWYLEQLWPGSRRRTPAEEALRIAGSSPS